MIKHLYNLGSYFLEKIIKASQVQDISFLFVIAISFSLYDAVQDSEINNQLPRFASYSPGFVIYCPGNFEQVTQLFQSNLCTYR